MLVLPVCVPQLDCAELPLHLPQGVFDVDVLVPSSAIAFRRSAGIIIIFFH